jgi:hypothetical protein
MMRAKFKSAHQARAKSVTKKTGLTGECNEKMPTKKMILTCNALKKAKKMMKAHKKTTKKW